MAKQTKGAMAQYGSMLGPVAGGVIAVLLIVGAVMTDKVSEHETSLRQINQTVQNRLDDSQTTQPTPELPAPLAVNRSLNPREGGARDLPVPVDGLRRYPVSWDVSIEAGALGIFDRLDVDQTNGLSEAEFRSWEGYDPNDNARQFRHYDRNGDGVIDRNEFANPPERPKTFDELNANGGEYLDAPGEITQSQLEAMDHDQDGRVSRADYEKYLREGPPKLFDLPLPANLRVELDPIRMEVQIAWEAGSAGGVPEDLEYWIFRRSPEARERQMAEYRRRINEHEKLLNEWTSRMNAWLRQTAKVNAQGQPDPNGADHPEGKTWGEVVQGVQQRRAMYATATGDKELTFPQQPPEWEPVARTTGTTFVDRSFDLGVTYTYAIRATTSATLRRGSNFELVSFGEEAEKRKATALVIQQSPPVLARNRIEVAWQGAIGSAGSVRLTQWLRLQGQGGVSWYRISIVESRLDPADTPSVGGEYTIAQLTARDATLTDAEATPAGTVAEVLPADMRVDFRTGYTFIRGGGRGFVLNHPEYGDMFLPRATSTPGSVFPSPVGLNNPAEVRLLAMKESGSAIFEVSRWHAVDGDWFRVVLTQTDVASGAIVGRDVNLASPGSGVRIFDTGGQLVRSNAKFQGQTARLSCGPYQGVQDRVAKVGGAEFDLFGSLYVE